MPLGFERINERQQRPNALINFIKPLEGPDKATAQEFLSRIAAQCYPVMKKHYISVMALEEYAPNPEFLGRNFNAGEVIQLVLKDKQGRWLSMKFVQMVMMHELAHCKQMNHSKFFWQVRNDYAQQMEGLWRDKYMGEGMWGRGRGLENGDFVNAAAPDNTQIPEHLCGGSYRRRGRKRKRGAQSGDQPEKLTYAERQQRRIAKKFGKHGGGESLGDDELLRGALETSNGGKRGTGKPRVANSKRGRELRAAAALARFGSAKQKEPEKTPDLEEDLDSETDWEDGDELGDDQDAVVISDGKGCDLVKVCGDGEDDDEGAGKEKDELHMLIAAPKDPAPKGNAPKGRVKQVARNLRSGFRPRCSPSQPSETESEAEDTPTRKPPRKRKYVPAISLGDSETEGEVEEKRPKLLSPVRFHGPGTWDAMGESPDDENLGNKEPQLSRSVEDLASETTLSAEEADLLREIDCSNAASMPDDAAPTPRPAPTPQAPEKPFVDANTLVCSICSLENAPDSPICVACSNVLRPRLMPNCWRCKSETCVGSKYINPGDAGRCGLCGAQKPKVAAEGGKGVGVTRPEVLRWD